MANQKIIEGKSKIVDEIVEKAKNSSSFVLFENQGMTVAETTELRNSMRKANVDYKVYKNNLVKLALHECGIKELDDKRRELLIKSESAKAERNTASAAIAQACSWWL